VDTERLSLKDAAERANVSPRTIRRWIKEGKLTGDKEPGPYGEQYSVSAEQLERAQNAKELAPPAQPGESTAQVVRAILDERDAAITNALESLRADVGQGIQRQDDGMATLRDEIRALRETIERMGSVSETRRPWWKRMLGR